MLTPIHQLRATLSDFMFFTLLCLLQICVSSWKVKLMNYWMFLFSKDETGNAHSSSDLSLQLPASHNQREQGHSNQAWFTSRTFLWWENRGANVQKEFGKPLRQRPVGSGSPDPPGLVTLSPCVVLEDGVLDLKTWTLSCCSSLGNAENWTH